MTPTSFVLSMTSLLIAALLLLVFLAVWMVERSGRP
jgi:hypothetical protein